MRTIPTLLLAGALILGACGGPDGASGGAGPDGDAPTAPDGAPATAELRIGLQELDGVFVEGFQLTLLVEDATGAERTYRWEELVTGDRLEWPPGVGPEDLERWYTGTLVTDVPAGTVAVTSELDVGMEPPGRPCRVEMDAPAGADLEVRIRLTDPDRGCPVEADPAT